MGRERQVAQSSPLAAKFIPKGELEEQNTCR